MKDFADIWLNHDNGPPLVLISAGRVLSLSAVTRVTVNFGGSPVTIIDSNTSPTAFDWSTQVEWPYGSGTMVDALHLKFGGESIAAGEYPDCILTLYDSSHPNGKVFTDKLKIRTQEVYA